jgi:NhaP-type Na+/H+ or K+/H+ antiporter
LPALVFILLFGLFLGNLDQMVGLKFIQRLRPERLEREVHRFTEITAEVTFLIRSLFFLLFGFLIETSELLNPDSFIAAVTITAAIFLTRYLSLLILRIPPWPVLFIAPRGLITILLFLSVPVALQLNVADRSLIIQVNVLCALVMMFGMMAAKPEKPGDSLPRPEDQSPLNMHQPSN